MREKRNSPENGAVPRRGTSPVRIEHRFPEDQRTLAANHITVQHTNEGEFTIAFFDVVQPVVLGEPKDVKDQIAKIKSVPATCIARISIGAGRMPGLIGALIANYETFERDTGKAVRSDDEQEGEKHAS